MTGVQTCALPIYDNFAKQYAQILARYGVALEVRNSAGAVEDLDLLRDPSSGVQAALTSFGVTLPDDANTLYSLGGIFDAPIYIFYRNQQPITALAQFRGKRLAIGMPGTALRSLIFEVLKATDALDGKGGYRLRILVEDVYRRIEYSAERIEGVSRRPVARRRKW